MLRPTLVWAEALHPKLETESIQLVIGSLRMSEVLSAFGFGWP